VKVQANGIFSLSTTWRHVGGEELQLHSFLASTVDGGEWFKLGFGRLTPGTQPRYRLHRRLCGPQNRSGRFWEEKSLSPEPKFQPRIVQPITIPAFDYRQRWYKNNLENVCSVSYLVLCYSNGITLPLQRQFHVLMFQAILPYVHASLFIIAHSKPKKYTKSTEEATTVENSWNTKLNTSIWLSFMCILYTI
jgi:hypothetical protein